MTTPWSEIAEARNVEWTMDSYKGFRKDLVQEVLLYARRNTFLLDVGCGSAVIRSELPKWIRYTGFDFTPEFIKIAKKKFPKDTFRQGDITGMPFFPKSFDIVISSAVLQHIKEWKKALEEMVRVSRGLVITATRVHSKPTDTVPDSRILRQRFHPADILMEMGKYGNPSWRWARGYQMGIFILNILRD